MRFEQFVSSAKRVLVSFIKYERNESTYFLEINRFSDETPDERRRILVKPDKMTMADTNFRVKRGVPDGLIVSGISKFLEILNKGKDEDIDVQQKTSNLKFQIDWRNKSNCLMEPKISQDECHSCYAIISMRMFEWLYCTQRGNKVKFSEQYLINCGEQYGLNGCEESNMGQVLKFISSHGLLLYEQMPYLDRQEACPSEYAHMTSNTVLAADTTAPSGPFVPLDIQRRVLKVVPAQDELNEQPLIVFIQLADDFLDYGGGIYESEECNSELGHFMLLVGRGEDGFGRKFLLLSNSFGEQWGESGYIRLSHNSYHCIVFALRVEANFT